MAETQDAPPVVASTEEKKAVPGNIVSRGPATSAKLNDPGQQASPAATGDAVIETDNGTGLIDEQKAAAATAAADVKNLPEVNDDQLREILKARGIEMDDKGFDGLKEKLKPAAAAAKEPTAEEKVAAEKAMDKRMLDFFMANGGTPENFVAIKQVASTDLTALSESAIRHELKDADFDEDEIKAIMLERYYQINPTELVRDEDNETEEEFNKRKSLIEKKVAFGAKKLELKGSYTKKQAENALNTLREALKLEDEQKEEDVKNSLRVEEIFTKLPRKVTLELGKAGDGQDIAPSRIRD